MPQTSIRPGDLVVFKFWSTYLAQLATSQNQNNNTWHELWPGDRGLVIHVGSDVSSSMSKDDTVSVIFSRVGRMLRVHINQLERIE